MSDDDELPENVKYYMRIAKEHPKQGFRRSTFTPDDKPPLFARLPEKTLRDMESRLASILLMLPLMSKQLGHRNVCNTLIDYMRPDNDPAAVAAVDFLRDIFTMSTNDVISKWYGKDISPTAVLMGSIGK